MIYFIQDESTCHIKIGFTDSPGAKARLKALQTGCPTKLRVLFTMPGDHRYEQKLHEYLAPHRVRGEWFRPVPALLDFILKTAGDESSAEGYETGRREALEWAGIPGSAE